MKRRNKHESKIVRSSKADEIVKTYHELGFSPADHSQGASPAGNGAWLAPVSFLPHIDYTISSVVGGF